MTIDTRLSHGQVGKVKDAIKTVAEELGITIPNFVRVAEEIVFQATCG